MKIDQIIHSKRKTFAIVVTRDGNLVVRAPLRATDAQIESMVNENSKWIRSKQEEVRIKRSHEKPKQFVDGVQFPFLGKWYPLEIVDRQDTSLNLEDRFLLSREALLKAELEFANWYRMKAHEIIKGRLEYYALRYNFKFNQVRIKDIHTRWGSCSMKGNLNFNYRLVLASIDVVDYVVVHELVHLSIKNHSKTFWAGVEHILPNYRISRTWLRKNGSSLNLFTH